MSESWTCWKSTAGPCPKCGSTTFLLSHPIEGQPGTWGKTVCRDCEAALVVRTHLGSGEPIVELKATLRRIKIDYIQMGSHRIPIEVVTDFPPGCQFMLVSRNPVTGAEYVAVLEEGTILKARVPQPPRPMCRDGKDA
jgi:hypothetical protein